MPFLVYYRPLMTSSRLILIFLGFIFLIIVILSSNRIAGFLRERFGKFLPANNTTVETTPTPTSFMEGETPTPTLIPGTTSTPSGEIPSTGPTELAYLILGGSLVVGLAFKKVSDSSVSN